jgi:hypothetical protein
MFVTVGEVIGEFTVIVGCAAMLVNAPESETRSVVVNV